MNPFTIPDNIFIAPYPQDMRAGIHKLSATITAEFGRDSMDGSLYVFISRDARKAKLLHFDVNGWCLHYCYLAQGTFKWKASGKDTLLLIERRQLFWLLDGLPIVQPKAPKPVTAHVIL